MPARNFAQQILMARAKPDPPSADGKMSGVVNFIALHETTSPNRIPVRLAGP